MIIDNVLKLRNAQRNYLLKGKYNLANDVLYYVKKSIIANRNEIENLIVTNHEKCFFENIEDTIDSEIQKDSLYKTHGELHIKNKEFIQTSLLMPIGIIAVETPNVLEMVKYFVKAIKSRNAILISDSEYNKKSVKMLILEIVKNALRKFEIDEDLIMILRYEDCFYDYFDKVIHLYDTNGNILKSNKYQEKEMINKKFVYVENEEFYKIAKKCNENEEYELVTGNFGDTVDKICKNYIDSATIYTTDAQKAYQFINLVKGQNVFVNASLKNRQPKLESPDELYEYKNIIIPIPRKKVVYQKNKETVLHTNERKNEKVNHFFKNFFGK